MSFTQGEVINATKYPTIGHLAKYLYAKMMASFPNTMLHIVCDSYISGSLKGTERDRRG